MKSHEEGVLEVLNGSQQLFKSMRGQEQQCNEGLENLPPSKHLRVLLVEDDDSTRHVVAALLRNCGYRVVAAPNGLQAWALLQRHSRGFDLILTNVVMPGLSGIGLLSRVMHRRDLKDVPVVMMSSNDSTSLVYKCLVKGAVDFLVKPVRKNELKNLWQHSWRRCHSSSGSKSEDGTERADRVSSSEGLSGCDSEDVGMLDHSDNGSGTQTSCTMLENGVPARGLALKPTKRQPRTNSETVQKPVANAETGDEACQRAGNRDACSPELERAADLLGNVSNVQTEANLIMKRTQADAGESERRGSNNLEIAKNDNDNTSDPNSGSRLELTLRTAGERPSAVGNERKVLGHSGPSAFSRYTSVASTEILNKDEDKHKITHPAGGLPAVQYATLVYDTGLPPTAYFYAQPPLPPWQHAFSPQQMEQHRVPTGQPQQKQPQPTVPPEEMDVQHAHVHHHHHHVHHHHHNNNMELEASTNEQPGRFSGGSYAGGGSVSGSNCGNFVSNSGSSPGIPSSNGGATPSEENKVARREAALNKFRQKRKERCFEKKVRYQSRKRLAEQRPRVRGQFVSQAVYDSSKLDFQEY